MSIELPKVKFCDGCGEILADGDVKAEWFACPDSDPPHMHLVLSSRCCDTSLIDRRMEDHGKAGFLDAVEVMAGITGLSTQLAGAGA